MSSGWRAGRRRLVSLRGEGGVIGLFEEVGDGIGRHFWLIVVKNNYLRARGVFFQTRGARQVS